MAETGHIRPNGNTQRQEWLTDSTKRVLNQICPVRSFSSAWALWEVLASCFFCSRSDSGSPPLVLNNVNGDIQRQERPMDSVLTGSLNVNQSKHRPKGGRGEGHTIRKHYPSIKHPSSNRNIQRQIRSVHPVAPEEFEYFGKASYRGLDCMQKINK